MTLKSFIKRTGLFSSAFLFVMMFGTAAFGQAGRTFVSGSGLDVNSCSPAAPCRTFNRAISQTNAGGEVIVLDSAGYGPFSVSHAVTVEAPAGVYAGITVTTGDGIDVNVQTSDVVILRGLTINSQGSAGNGISFNTGGTLNIENCVLNGFGSGQGLAISTAGNVFVKDTIARGNGAGIEAKINTTGVLNVNLTGVHCDGNGAGIVLGTLSGTLTASIGNSFALGNSQQGIAVQATTGVVNVSMDHVHSDGNGQALSVQPSTPESSLMVTVRDSSLSNSQTFGVVLEGSQGNAAIDLESCLVTSNGTGISLQGGELAGGQVSISNCTITRNATAGFAISSSGAILSRGSNTLIGNGANVGSVTPLTGQ